MTGWIILAVILAVFFVISLVRLGVRVTYNADDLAVILIVGPGRVQLIPPKDKKEEKSDRPKKDKKTKAVPQESDLKKKSGGTVGRIMKLLPVVAEAAGKLLHKIRIDRLDIALIWCADDAASAAIGYGRANAAMGMIWPLIDHNFKVKHSDIRIDIDYEKSVPEITADAAVTLTVGQLVSFVAIYGTKLLINWSRSGKTLRERQEAFQ